MSDQKNREDGQEKKVSFKVVDRRRFTDDGDQRDGPDVPRGDKVRVDPPMPKAPPAPAPQAAAQAGQGPAAGPVDDDAPPGALNFSMFLQSLAQQGLMQMGLIPWPHGQRELALDAARDTIDILELLKKKTKGNLGPEEQKLMDTVVNELKLSFVEVQQAIARSRAGAMKPPPGVPR